MSLTMKRYCGDLSLSYHYVCQSESYSEKMMMVINNDNDDESCIDEVCVCVCVSVLGSQYSQSVSLQINQSTQPKVSDLISLIYYYLDDPQGNHMDVGVVSCPSLSTKSVCLFVCLFVIGAESLGNILGDLWTSDTQVQ